MPANLATAARRKYILSLIPSTGISIASLAKLLKITPSSAGDRLREYMASGLVFVARARVEGAQYAEAYYFTDREECEAFREHSAAKAAERRDAHNKANWKRVSEEAKAAARQSYKIKVKVRKALGELAPQRGTLTAKPLDAWKLTEPVNTAGIKPVEVPNTLRNRFAVDDVPPLFSSLRPGQYIAPAPAWVEAVTA